MATSLKKITKMVDEYDVTRETRLAEQRKVDKIEEKEKKLKTEIMAALQAQKSQGVTGSRKRAELVKKKFPSVTDQAALDKFSKRKGNEDIIKHTLNAAAVKERWENGEVIPGVKAEEVISLSLTKV